MKRKIIPYNPRLKELARDLRKSGNLSEILLWKCLKGKQIMGYDFHRQSPIDEYIVDFFCPELSLAVEIDGWTHLGKYEKDVKRQKKLESMGVRFLRFGDKDIKQNMEGVLLRIKEWIKENSPPIPL
ncbi:MAG: DUF559 domain-containing protein [Nitrospinae bacterium]|nr:DUF559 domain-containing protein [Nitrospinota bacterium]